MVGKEYLLNAKVYLVKDYRFEGENITIVTDRKEFTFHTEYAEEKLAEFLPVADEDEPVDTSDLVVYNEVKSSMSVVAATLKGNLEKLQTDPSYVKQAMAMNNTINTMMNCVKVEIQAAGLQLKRERMRNK